MPSLAEVERSLLGPGAPFELARELVLGHEMSVFARRLPSLRAMLEGSRGHGDAEYCVCEGRRLTFAEHFRSVAAFAHVLRDTYGVAKGDRVAILAENGPEWIVAFWSAVSLGAIAVGMNGWWVRDEIVYALDDCGPRVLIADEKRLARLRSEDLRVPVISIEKDFAAFATGRMTRYRTNLSTRTTLLASCTPAERRAVRKVPSRRTEASWGSRRCSSSMGSAS